ARSPPRSTPRRRAGRSRPTRSSCTTTASPRAATSPPGNSRRSSPTKSAPPSARCAPLEADLRLAGLRWLAQQLGVVLAQLRRAARDAPWAGGQPVGRAGVAERAAEVFVLDRNLEAARLEVFVLERLLGRIDHAHRDAAAL